ncbi:MAG: acetate kinase [Candidatus Neomarinimicrobiota bacterium]
MKVLVFNCGSSSIKYRLYDMPSGENLSHGLVQRIGDRNSMASQIAHSQELSVWRPVSGHQQGMELIAEMLTHPEKGVISSLDEIGACGHRVVHGGEAFTGSVKVDDKLEATIEEYFDLAPLHNPPNLTGIKEAQRLFGNIPQVACFDTAFHQTIPEVAFLYALPYEFYQENKVRRYGFHGTSHRFVARRAAELLGKDKYAVNLISCHLGNGCSVAAISQGKSIDTSMGLTPLEGLAMGTRSGDLDPEIVFFLQRKGFSPDELSSILNKKSGLLGLSGVSNDVRDLEELATGGHTRARLALEVFAYRIRKYIGAYLAILKGVDGIIFTGGIGENGWLMRERILSGLDHLGIILDPQLNERANGGELQIQSAESRIKLFVIPTNEEIAIAHDTFRIASNGSYQTSIN